MQVERMAHLLSDDFQSLSNWGTETETERECFITLNYQDAMYVQFSFWLCFTMRSNDNFNFPTG